MSYTTWTIPAFSFNILLSQKDKIKESIMKTACKCAFQEYMAKTLEKVRFENKLTQEKFAEVLMINTRSYSNLETGKSCCCTLTFIFFLVFCCKDVQSFIDDLRIVILKSLEGEEISSP